MKLRFWACVNVCLGMIYYLLFFSPSVIFYRRTEGPQNPPIDVSSLIVEICPSTTYMLTRKPKIREFFGQGPFSTECVYPDQAFHNCKTSKPIF